MKEIKYITIKRKKAILTEQKENKFPGNEKR